MYRFVRRHVVGLAIVLMLVLGGVSLCIGSFPLSFFQIVDVLLGRMAGTMEANVFFQLRLPRVLVGILAGAALGVAGSTFQILFHNPLASPDVTGVASGASLGAAIAIVLGAGNAWQIMSGAFLFGILSLAAVLLLVRFSAGEHTGSYILAGILVSSVSDGGLMILKTVADPENELAAIEFWTMGSLGNVTAGKLGVVAIVILPLSLLLLFRRQLLILSLGTDNARGVGLDPFFWRTVFLILTAFMVACVVSVIGVVAFIGLIAPHIAFLLTGERGEKSLIVSMFVGSAVIVLSDIAARTVSPGAEIPLSIPTIALAVPILILLMCRRKKELE